jgi:hypothetical protein
MDMVFADVCRRCAKLPAGVLRIYGRRLRRPAGIALKDYRSTGGGTFSTRKFGHPQVVKNEGLTRYSLFRVLPTEHYRLE